MTIFLLANSVNNNIYFFILPKLQFISNNKFVKTQVLIFTVNYYLLLTAVSTLRVFIEAGE